MEIFYINAKKVGSGEKPHLLPPGVPRGSLGKKAPKTEILLFSPHFGRKKKYSFARSSRTSIQNPNIPKNSDRALFRSIFASKMAKKGQNVGGPKNFSSGWIFCFSLVFNYFIQFLYGIFLKSLKIEIESCTEPKTLGRSKNLKFASCQYF